LKTRPKQLLGTLPLDIALPGRVEQSGFTFSKKKKKLFPFVAQDWQKLAKLKSEHQRRRKE
jgi:hypothetical protein